jgi:6-phosphogluconolactonase
MRYQGTILKHFLFLCLLLMACIGVRVSCSIIPDSSSILLYIGTYTENDSFIDGKASGIYIYSMNLSTGELTFVGQSPECVNPSYLAFDPAGEFLFSVNERGDPTGFLTSYRLTQDGRQIIPLNTVSSQGTYPCHLQVDLTGGFVFTANYGDGIIAVFPISATGLLEDAISVFQHAGSGPDPRQASAHAHMVSLSADSRFVYSCDLGTDKVYIYQLDALTGRLTDTQAYYSTQPGAGPRHLALHTNKKYAYIINELNGTIEFALVDSITGRLSRQQVISTIPPKGSSTAACADIHISPSGRYLYASNRGNENSIAIYSIDICSGNLALVGHQPVEGRTPRSFVIDPTGTFLLVGNQDSDCVVTFAIDPETGLLTDTSLRTRVPAPACLKFKPLRKRPSGNAS